jgi:hypothetical protein
MNERKLLLTEKELLAKAGIERACRETGHEVFPLLKFSNAVTIGRTGLSPEDFEYATKAHIDFVLSKDNRPELAIEFDGSWLDYPRSIKAERKDRLAYQLGLNLVRIDASSVQKWELEMYMYEIVKRWHRPGSCNHIPKTPYKCRCNHHQNGRCPQREDIARLLSETAFKSKAAFDFMVEIREPNYWSTNASVILSNGVDRVPIGFGFATTTGDVSLCRRALAEDSALRYATDTIEVALRELGYQRQSYYAQQVAERPAPSAYGLR